MSEKPGMTFLVLSNPATTPTGIVEIMDKLEEKYAGPSIISFFHPLEPCAGADEEIENLIQKYDGKNQSRP